VCRSSAGFDQFDGQVQNLGDGLQVTVFDVAFLFDMADRIRVGYAGLFGQGVPNLLRMSQ